MKKMCANCVYAGDQFKIVGLTHLHCESPKMKKYFEEDKCPSAWESLRKFSESCEDFKPKKQNYVRRK